MSMKISTRNKICVWILTCWQPARVHTLKVLLIHFVIKKEFLTLFWGGGYFMYVRRLGWGKFAPTFYFHDMHVLSMKIGMDVFNHLHFQYLIEKISGKVLFSLFSWSLFLAVLRVLQIYIGKYIGKIPISCDEKSKKNRSLHSFSFIFSGKLLDKIILKVRKNEKKFSSGWKLKSRNGGANLPHPPGIGLR